LTPWTAEEVKVLRENFGKISLGKIADKLGRSKSSVKGKVRTLRLNEAKPREAQVIQLAVKRENDAKPANVGDCRIERLKRLRDSFERDFEAEVVPPLQKPNFSREYRAILAEIDELEQVDERKDGEGTAESGSLASAIAELAKQQQRYLDRAAM
jgi:hypothetical protein